MLPDRLRGANLAGLTGVDAGDVHDPLRLETIRQVPSAAGDAVKLQHEAQENIATALPGPIRKSSMR